MLAKFFSEVSCNFCFSRGPCDFRPYLSILSQPRIKILNSYPQEWICDIPIALSADFEKIARCRFHICASYGTPVKRLFFFVQDIISDLAHMNVNNY